MTHLLAPLRMDFISARCPNNNPIAPKMIDLPAGKSIILGAIGLLLGQRADMKSIRNGANKCVIEAHFNLLSYHMESFFMENDIDYDAEECILRRELYASLHIIHVAICILRHHNQYHFP